MSEEAFCFPLVLKPQTVLLERGGGKGICDAGQDGDF